MEGQMDIETYLHLIAQIEKGLAEITEKEASLSATEALLCYLLDLELAKAEYELEKEKDK
jgi:hypothetical protein